MGKQQTLPGPLRRHVRRRVGQIRRNPGLLALIAVVSLPTLYSVGLLIHRLYL
ncbi:hypothetical protein ACWGCW_31965 [Streptomyces sp. NPDC054933]